MKKYGIFIFILITISIVVGCFFFTKNRTILHEDDNGITSLRTISTNEIKKIKIGMTMEEVCTILGNGMVGDRPNVSILYFSEDGEGYNVLFFELQDRDTFGEFKGSVTGIYYYNDFRKPEGYFLLPKAWKGKAWEEVLPTPRS